MIEDKTQEEPEPRGCWFWKKGNCRRGGECAYEHAGEEGAARAVPRQEPTEKTRRQTKTQDEEWAAEKERVEKDRVDRAVFEKEKRRLASIETEKRNGGSRKDHSNNRGNNSSSSNSSRRGNGRH